MLMRADATPCLVITVLIGATSYVGDVLLYSLKSSVLRAVSDNLTHALVGGLSWALVVKLSKKSTTKNLSGIIICLLVSSLIDLDHFLLAKSWKLRDARHLREKRPILHCSALPLLVWLIFELNYKYFRHATAGYYMWVIITAFISHHVRDANRRGMWFGFMGTTPAIPYYLYISIAMVLPHFIYWVIPHDVIKDDHVFSVIQSI